MEEKLNSRLLRSEMVLHGDTNKTLSEYLGINASSLNNKIHEKGGSGFNRKELFQIKKRYGLSNDKFVDIFFENMVS